jgi:hypothetical protein
MGHRRVHRDASNALSNLGVLGGEMERVLMSEYTTVQTEITNADLLRLALQDVGLPFEEATVEACGDRNGLSLVGYLGDTRPQKVQFAIRRRNLGRLSNDSVSPVLGGIGWAWDESAQRYFAYVSDYPQDTLKGCDTHLSNVKQAMEQVAQRAAYHQIIKTVNEYGMMVESETVTPGGEIQVVVRTF